MVTTVVGLFLGGLWLVAAGRAELPTLSDLNLPTLDDPSPPALGEPVALQESMTQAEALYFGDLEGNVEIPASVLPADVESWSIECRFKLFALPRQPMRLVSQWNDEKGESVTDRGRFQLTVGPGSRVAFRMRTAREAEQTLSGTWAKPDKAWHHLAATLTNGSLQLILDGKVAAKLSVSDETRFAASELPVVIGHFELLRTKDKTPPLVEGFVADVSFWKVYRDAAVIAEELTQKRTGKEPGLLAAYPLIRAAGGISGGFVSGVTAEGATVKGLPKGVPDARIVGPLAKVGWYETPLWNDPSPTRPWLHMGRSSLALAPKPIKGSQSDAPPVLSGQNRRIVANDKTNEAGVVWQEPGTKEMFLTWLQADLSGVRCTPLPTLENSDLVAATWGPAGHVYYLMIESLPGGRPESQVPKSMIRLVRPDGEMVHEAPVDMGPGAFSWYTPHGRGNMACSDRGVSVILPRTFCNGDPTGKAAHHQGAVTATFSLDLSDVKIFGNSASHSFGNILSTASSRDPMGLELGDCFPRALQLHRFIVEPRGPGYPPKIARQSKKIYNYICHQITINEPDNPMKVSHDANTYTELGGVAEGKVSYSVVFAADRSPEGKTLDYDRVGKQGDPRDIALLRVVKNFETVPGDYDVQDALMVWGGTASDVPQPAPPETGEFRLFTGQHCRQRNTGLIWLTNYGVGEAARAPHVVRRRDGTILIVWEKQGGSDGGSLWAMVIHESGKAIVDPVRLGVDLVLDREDPIVQVGPRDYFLARDRTSNEVQLCWFLDPSPNDFDSRK